MSGVRMEVSVAGDQPELPDTVVLRVNDWPMGMTCEQATSLAAALTSAVIRIEQSWDRAAAARTWLQPQQGVH